MKRVIACICAVLALVMLAGTAVPAFADTEVGVDAETGIRYVCFGSGDKTMVVVPGLSVGFVTDSGAALEDAFAEFTDEYTVYLFDVREDVPADYTISAMSEDLVCAVKNLGLENIYMYGCSMGGMQCIYIAGTYPELVAKIAVASSACKANETSEAVIGSWIELAKEGRCAELCDSMGQLIYSKALYEANGAYFAAMAEGMNAEITERFINTASVIPGLDLTQQAEAIECPVLVIGAQGDRVLSFEATQLIAELTCCEIIFYGEEYPHAVYDEAPGFKADVKAFFDAA